MERNSERVAGGKLALTFTLAPDEVQGFERRALDALGAAITVDGFRPGKAPADLVRARVGQEALLEETVSQAVRQLYPAAVRELKLEVLGRPTVSAITVSPFSFKVEVATLPEVSLGKWQKVRVKKNPVTVGDEEISKVMLDLRESRASEVAVVRPAQLGDRVEMDFEVSTGGVVIDGGKGMKYPVILGKRQLVPGFEDQVVGLVAGGEKEFDFSFPESYRKDLAGKPAHCKVKLHQVFERTLPEASDEFAKYLGKFESIGALLDKLKQNLTDEKQAHEDTKVELAMLEALVEVASFGDIPEVLLHGEIDKMLHEFRHSMESRGLVWSDYLVSIGRDEVKLHDEFRTPAERRVKVALIMRMFANQESLAADDMAVQNEVAKVVEQHVGDERVAAQVNSDDHRDYLKGILTNQKVVSWLKERLVE